MLQKYGWIIALVGITLLALVFFGQVFADETGSFIGKIVGGIALAVGGALGLRKRNKG
jgi:hypothetical protein